MKYAVLLFFFLLLPYCVGNIFAQENNKFGIHLAQPQNEDIERASELVNSNGGKWGYVTLVIQENDRDPNKWQDVFDKLRRERLIPIIRLATQGENANWRRPNESDADSWVHFLNKLNWVVKDRYIILFNEPNHATEWGGEVDPISFAKVNKAFAEKLKKSNPDYFIMMGGLDDSAPSSLPQYEDAGIFLEKVVTEIGDDDFNNLFDGLAAHSYPNPGFVGSPTGSGRKSVRSYEWELGILQSLGIKELPVYITETGWHGNALSRETVASNFTIAYSNVWLPDSRVKAVTPFVLNYQSEPFLQFSWLKQGSNEVYPEFEAVKNLPKDAGVPEQREIGRFNFDLPTEIVENSTYHFQIDLENKGQAIWSHDDAYSLKIEGIPETRYLISSIGTIRPFDHRVLDVYLTTLDELGESETQFVLFKEEKDVIRSKPWKFTVVPLPSLDFKVSLFPRFSTSADNFEIQFFDEYEQLVFKQYGIRVESGIGHIDKVENIALNRKYRVVVLQKNYLPRQTFVRFKKGNNEIKFEPMIALDFSEDGALNWDDIGALFSHPDKFRLILPF